MNEKVKIQRPAFFALAKTIPSIRLRNRIYDVCDEKTQYVADELLLLSEEILSQVSAYGVCLYLEKGEKLQTERNNDYILHELFLNERHQNAGPVFFNVCKIVEAINDKLSAHEFEPFQESSPIHQELKKLAVFRNSLMHGFFKLPGEKNLEIIDDIHTLLLELDKLKVFSYTSDVHFWQPDKLDFKWYIEDDVSWDKLANKTTFFGILAGRAKEELNSNDFVNNVPLREEISLEESKENELERFLSENQSNDFKESLYVQFHSEDKKNQDTFYEWAFTYLSKKAHFKVISFGINSSGISYTSYLLFKVLCKQLGLPWPRKDVKGKMLQGVKSYQKKEKKQVLILVNNIHLVPFASDHMTELLKFFKDAKVRFIGIGHEYEHLSSMFSQRLDFRDGKNSIPDHKELEYLLANHTRHRGPFEQDKEYPKLKELLRLICDRLKAKKPVIARQLADEEKVNVELVNEALYILYPYFKYDQSGQENNYENDEPDEMFGFPKRQTETTSILLTLGRRDIELEYKHKILKS